MDVIQKFRNERGKRKRPSYLVSLALREFTRFLREEWDCVCPNCERKIEYEKLGRESLARHCDGICAEKRQGAARSQGAMTSSDNGVEADGLLLGGCNADNFQEGANDISKDDSSDKENATEGEVKK